MVTDIGTARAPHGLEVKYLPFDVKAAVGAGGQVEGYASLFGEADQGGDIVAPGAFVASLKRLAEAGRKVKFLWQHDPARPIGIWHEVREDGRGLKVSGRILADVAQGAEALALVRAGAVDGLSIGYRTVRAESSRETGGRRLLEIDLWEVSLVTFPMLPTARAMLAVPSPAEIMELALAEALADAAGHPR